MSSLAGFGAESQPKSNLLHFGLKYDIWWQCNYFSENQLTKLKLCPQLPLPSPEDYCDTFCVAGAGGYPDVAGDGSRLILNEGSSFDVKPASNSRRNCRTAVGGGSKL